MRANQTIISHKRALLACLTFSCMVSSVSHAALITLDSLTVNVPSGSNNTSGAGTSTNPYTDDVLLDSVTFDGITLSVDNGQISAIQSAYIDSGRDNTNAEWGDDDDGGDGNTDPFTRVGIDVFNADGSVNLAVQESTDPAVQDIALASAFSSLSLSEITDGEGTNSVSNFIFNFGVKDNDTAVDLLPEIVLFERGNNDTTTVRAITGGTFDNPTLQGAITITEDDMWNTGEHIDTTEIDDIQQLAAIGIDLNDFGITDGSIVYGLQIDTDGGDFGGFFQAAEDPDTQFSDDVPDGLNNPDGTVPEPSAFALLLGLTAAFFCTRRPIR